MQKNSFFKFLTNIPIYLVATITLTIQSAFAVPLENKLNEDNLKQYTSVFDISTQGPVKLIQDNVAAFNEKVRLIRNAKESLDLMYYIYSDDESSSYMSKELIKAAQRGVKIRVLLDYISSYKLMDSFIAIQNEAARTGTGSIEFRFYGRPTPNIIRDVIYMTTICDDSMTHDACVEHKKTEANKFIDSDKIKNAGVLQKDALLADARNANSGLSGVFLSGIYGKSGNTLKFLFHVLGYDKKLANTKNSTNLSPDDKAKAKELIKLYLKSKRGDPGSVLKLKIASLFMGDEIDPILDLLTEVLPVELQGADENRLRDWDHFTDYLHHKLLLADSKLGYELILGGRNIENSYHMQKNPSGKYTFIDTDAIVAVNSSSALQIKATFAKLWNFKAMTATVEDVLQHAPNDTMATLSQCEVLDAACAAKIPRTLEAVISSRTERIKLAIQNMNAQAEKYLSPNLRVYNTAKLHTPILVDKSVDTQARISYIENLPFDKNQNYLLRKYGSQVDREEKSGKYIHKIWANALLDTCGPEKGPQNIYLHSAYVVFPTPLLSAIAEMAKTASPINTFNSFNYVKRDCSNVTIKIITNSVETTDLSVINVFARVQMHALLQSIEKIRINSEYKKMNLASKAAKIEYYEYVVKPGERSDSLHTKISIIGTNAIVGSANADVRSYMMDTNNGLYIENAPSFVKQYTKFIEAQIQNPNITRRLDLLWRDGAITASSSYISSEISVLIKKIQFLLKDRKWAKDKYFKSLENIFKSVFLTDIVKSTLSTAWTFTNVSEHELDVLQAAHNEVGGPLHHEFFDIREVYKTNRHKKTTIDHLLELF